MPFSIEQIYKISEAINAMTSDEWDQIVIKRNTTNDLQLFLKLIGKTELLPVNDKFENTGTGNIVIVGETRLKKDKIEGIFGKYGINKKRLEIVPTYEDAKKYNFENTRFKSLEYAAIIIGPMPHNTIGVDGWSSTIAKIENEEGFPPVIRCSQNLHISNYSLNEAIQKAIYDRIIVPDSKKNTEKVES